MLPLLLANCSLLSNVLPLLLASVLRKKSKQDFANKKELFREISELIERMKLLQLKEIIVQYFFRKSYAKNSKNRCQTVSKFYVKSIRQVFGSCSDSGEKVRAYEIVKMALLDFLHSQILISRKIWMTEIDIYLI